MATSLLRVCQACSVTVRCVNSTAIRGFCVGSIRSVEHDKETHTGQSWSKDDRRNVRFLDGKEKLVNERFAIDLIAEQPVAVSSKRIVSCDGGGGPLGHPKVYINLDQPGNHICGYCGLRFTKKDHH